MERITYEDINIKPDEQSFIEKYNFVLRDTHLGKGYFKSLHWHDYFEFELMLKGNVSHVYNNKKESLSRGDAHLMTNFDIHSLEATTDLQLINIRFTHQLLSPEITDMLLNPTSKYACHFDEDELTYIEERIERLGSAQINSPYYKQITVSIISEIILLLLQKSNPQKETYIMPVHVQKTLSYVSKNFKKNITLISLSEMLNITPNYLGAEINKYIGMTFNDYLNNLRLKYSCDLLLNTEQSIKEIAFLSGYNSVEYYVLCFKKKLLMTPTVYRLQNQKKKKRINTEVTKNEC